MAEIELEPIVIGCGVLILLVVAGAAVVLWLRRRLWNEEEDGPLGAGFTLIDLTELHRAGKMTDDEYAKAKAKVLLATKKAAEARPKRPDSAPGR